MLISQILFLWSILATFYCHLLADDFYISRLDWVDDNEQDSNWQKYTKSLASMYQKYKNPSQFPRRLENASPETSYDFEQEIQDFLSPPVNAKAIENSLDIAYRDERFEMNADYSPIKISDANNLINFRQPTPPRRYRYSSINLSNLELQATALNFVVLVNNISDFKFAPAGGSDRFCATSATADGRNCNLRTAVAFCLEEIDWQSAESCRIIFDSRLKSIKLKEEVKFSKLLKIGNQKKSNTTRSINVIIDGRFSLLLDGNGTRFLATPAYNASGDYDMSLSSLSLENIKLRNFGNSDTNGGTIFLQRLGSFNLVNVDIIDSAANIGGIYLDQVSFINIHNSSVTSSSAISGAGFAIFQAGSVRVSDSIFTDNVCFAQAPGVSIDHAQQVEVIGSTFERNKVTRRTSIKISTEVLFGFAGGFGVFNASEYTLIKNNYFRQNRAQFGSAVTLSYCPNATVVGNVFSDNTAFAGTVFWVHHSGMGEPFNLSNGNNFTDHKGYDRNTVLYYGPKFATEALLQLHATPNVGFIESYEAPEYYPVDVKVTVFDYYRSVVTMENATLDQAITMKIFLDKNTPENCNCKGNGINNCDNADVLGRNIVTTSNGVAHFPAIGAVCLPNANFHATIEQRLQGLPVAFPIYTRARFNDDGEYKYRFYPDRVATTTATIYFRPCRVGEKYDSISSTKGTCSVCRKSYSFDQNLNNEITFCKECPIKAAKCEGDQIYLPPDTWRWSPTAINIFDCPLFDACIGGNITGTASCRKGHHGPTCAICDAGYYQSKTTKRCNPCELELSSVSPAQTSMIILLTIAIVSFMLYRIVNRQFYSVYAKTDDEDLSQEDLDNASDATFREKILNARVIKKAKSASLVTRGKICMVTYQIVVQAPKTFGYDFSFFPIFQKVLQAISVLNFDLVELVPAGCLVNNYNYLTFMKYSTLIPPVVLVVLIAVYFLSYLLRIFWIQNSLKRKEVESRYRIRLIFLFLLFSYFMLPALTHIIFGVFHCIDLDPYREGPTGSGVVLLKSDYDVSCDSLDYKSGSDWAVAASVVYSVGIPLLYCVLLIRNKHEIMNRGALEWVSKAVMIRGRRQQPMGKYSRMIEAIGFMFIAYKPHFWYWEIVEITRRLASTSLMSLLFAGSISQMTLSIVITLGYIKLYNSCNPYILPSEETMAEVGQFQIFFTFFLLAAGRLQALGDVKEFAGLYALLNYLLLLVNLMSAVLFVYYLYCDLIEFLRQHAADIMHHIRRKKKKRRTSVAPEVKELKLSPLMKYERQINRMSNEEYEISKQTLEPAKIIEQCWKQDIDMDKEDDILFFQEVVDRLSDEDIFRMQALIYINIVSFKRRCREKFAIYTQDPVLIGDLEDITAGRIAGSTLMIDVEKDTEIFKPQPKVKVPDPPAGTTTAATTMLPLDISGKNYNAQRRVALAPAPAPAITATATASSKIKGAATATVTTPRFIHKEESKELPSMAAIAIPSPHKSGAGFLYDDEEDDDNVDQYKEGEYDEVYSLDSDEREEIAEMERLKARNNVFRFGNSKHVVRNNLEAKEEHSDNERGLNLAIDTISTSLTIGILPHAINALDVLPGQIHVADTPWKFDVTNCPFNSWTDSDEEDSQKSATNRGKNRTERKNGTGSDREDSAVNDAMAALGYDNTDVYDSDGRPKIEIVGRESEDSAPIEEKGFYRAKKSPSAERFAKSDKPLRGDSSREGSTESLPALATLSNHMDSIKEGPSRLPKLPGQRKEGWTTQKDLNDPPNLKQRKNSLQATTGAISKAKSEGPRGSIIVSPRKERKASTVLIGSPSKTNNSSASGTLSKINSHIGSTPTTTSSANVAGTDIAGVGPLFARSGVSEARLSTINRRSDSSKVSSETGEAATASPRRGTILKNSATSRK